MSEHSDIPTRSPSARETKSAKHISFLDLPSSLINYIIVQYAKLDFEILKKLYQIEPKCGVILEECVGIITNDKDGPHQLMLITDGLQDLNLKVQSIDSGIRYINTLCFAYIHINMGFPFDLGQQVIHEFKNYL